MVSLGERPAQHADVRTTSSLLLLFLTTTTRIRPTYYTQSKKRGLSAEEKREKILEVFHETRDVFQLKDIEKLASKKGVVTQAVKDVLQSLVDDDLVCSDKIGAWGGGAARTSYHSICN